MGILDRVIGKKKTDPNQQSQPGNVVINEGAISAQPTPNQTQARALQPQSQTSTPKQDPSNFKDQFLEDLDGQQPTQQNNQPKQDSSVKGASSQKEDLMSGPKGLEERPA